MADHSPEEEEAPAQPTSFKEILSTPPHEADVFFRDGQGESTTLCIGMSNLEASKDEESTAGEHAGGLTGPQLPSTEADESEPRRVGRGDPCVGPNDPEASGAEVNNLEFSDAGPNDPGVSVALELITVGLSDSGVSNAGRNDLDVSGSAPADSRPSMACSNDPKSSRTGQGDPELSRTALPGDAHTARPDPGRNGDAFSNHGRKDPEPPQTGHGRRSSPPESPSPTGADPEVPSSGRNVSELFPPAWRGAGGGSAAQRHLEDYLRRQNSGGDPSGGRAGWGQARPSRAPPKVALVGQASGDFRSREWNPPRAGPSGRGGPGASVSVTRGLAEGSTPRPALNRNVGGTRPRVVIVADSNGRLIIQRLEPAPDPDPPIVTRDIPVSDTEPIVSSTQPEIAQSGNGWRRKVKGRCLPISIITVFICFLTGAIAGGIYAVHGHHKASSDNYMENKQVKDNGATFQGSFLFKESWSDQMANTDSSTFQNLASQLEILIDQIYSFSSLHDQFKHSTVTQLSKHDPNLILVTSVLKLNDNTRDADKPGLRAEDLQAAFLEGYGQLLGSQHVQVSRKKLAVRVITDSWSVTTTAGPERVKPPGDLCGEVRVLPDMRIVGGSEAKKGAYPWVVMLVENTETKTGVFFCGGSILDRWNVLTAAHCLYEEDFAATGLVDTVSRNITVIAGKHESNTTVRYSHEQRIPARAGYIHSDFEHLTTMANDIAVLRLSRPLQFNSRVAPICLPSLSHPLPPICQVAGWGSMDYETEIMPTTLRTTSLRTYNSTDCQRTFNSTFSSGHVGHDIGYFLNDGVMCAANTTFGGQDTCQGDSGGPLFCLQGGGSGGDRFYAQFGVVSWGLQCGVPGNPGFYTFLPHYVSWIHSQALPALDHKVKSGADYHCVSFAPLSDYNLINCQEQLKFLRWDAHCGSIGNVVSCVVNALADFHCRREDVFNTIINSDSLSLTPERRQQCKEAFNSSKGLGDSCHSFSLFNDSTLITCRAGLHNLRLDGQCSNITGVVRCLVTAMADHGRHCQQQQVLDVVVNAASMGLTSEQRRHCRANWLSQSGALCFSRSAVSSALSACTTISSCVSVLEVTLCVQSVVDPNWVQCTREELQSFIFGHFSASVPICSDYTLRTTTDGRQFMYVGGEWFVLCGDHWNIQEVSVACGQRGFRAGMASFIHRTDENVYVSDFRSVSTAARHSLKASGWMTVTCSGYETSLAECQLVRQITCPSSYLAASVCYNSIYRFSLSPSVSGGSYGYVRLSRDEGQGYVCVLDPSEAGAHQLCRAAGYVAGVTYTGSLTPVSASAAVWRTEMRCGAGAVDVNGCTRGRWQLQSLSNARCELAKVFCFHTKARLHNSPFHNVGIAQIYQTAPNGHDVILKTVCNQNGYFFTDVTAGILCRQLGFSRSTGIPLNFNPFYRPHTGYVNVHCNGTESGLEDCAPQDVSPSCTKPAVVKCYVSYHYQNLSLQLVEGSNEVKVYFGGLWGSICTDHWTDNEAAAICKQLGYSYGYRRFPPFEPNPRRDLPHVMHDVRCGVNVTSLRHCSFKSVASDVCVRVRAAAVRCSNRPEPVYTLRHPHASAPNQGQLYVTYNGTTAALRASLTNATAAALCRAMGYVTGERDFPGALTGGPQYWWASYHCADAEECLQAKPALIDCRSFPRDDYRCADPMMSVFCYTSAARVHTGPRQTTGIVQLYRKGQWWEVCHDDVTETAATVICRDIMGSPSASAIILRDVYRRGFYQTVQGSSAHCSRLTSSDCLDLDLTSTCESFNDDPAAVVCYHGNRPSDAITSWKLEGRSSGRVWVERYGVWGTVCNDHWLTEESRLLCTHLGHGSGTYDLHTVKHDSTTALWAWSVDCTAFSTELGSCEVNLTSVVDGQCRSNRDASVTCLYY